MPKWLINQSTLTDIADAIRTKKGTSGAITVSEMADEIASISGGGGGSEEPIAIYYGFNNNTSASADGNIVLVVTDSSYNGTYALCWANADGVMTNYAPIATLAVTAQKLGYVKMMGYKAIPKYATKIVACAVNSNNAVVATYNIPSAKLWNSTYYGEHIGSLMVFSDEHYGYETADVDFIKAITYGSQRESVLAMVGCGDLTSDGKKATLDGWKSLRDTNRGSTPVYSCNGNHESINGDSYMKTNPSNMRQYLDTDYVDETDNYFSKTIAGVLCLFVPIYEGVQSSVSAVMFSDTVLSWLESQLEAHRNERVLIFTHVPPHYIYAPYGYALGWDAYPFDIWGSKLTQSNRPLADRNSFLELMAHYKNAILFTGHSHIKFKNDALYDNFNICRYNPERKQTSGDCATMIHVSSLSVPRDIISGDARDQIYAEGEAAIVDIYPNHIRYRCMDVVGEQFYGFNEYLIDTTPVIIPGTVKVPVSITAVKTKTAYYTDETFSTSDVTATVTYDDASTASKSASDLVFGAVDITTIGTKSLSVSYTEDGETVSTTISISVSERPIVKTLTSISATKTKTSYEVGETFSTSDVVVTAHYSDSTTATVTTSATIGTVDTSTEGSKTLNISYSEGGVTETTTITITVTGSGALWTVMLNKRLDLDTGEIIDGEGYVVTTAFEYNGETTMHVENGIGSEITTIVGYDSNGNYLGEIAKRTGKGTKDFTAPAGLATVRWRWSNILSRVDASYFTPDNVYLS